ncbi:DUF2530 domain-containing protein [Streptosporangium sp. NPDC051023]|uniref:DUF2530 domain-containing protein n=1 Tax=Streptosporangium sp. NPDC051023 TaxID=3155410 RepID=UPI00344C6A1F
MNQPRLPDLQPLRTNDSAAILVGTGLWAAALVVLLIVRPDPAHQWWIWTCVSGICGGLFGLWFVRRRDRREGTRSPSHEASQKASHEALQEASQEPVEPVTALPPVSSSSPASPASPSSSVSSAPPVTPAPPAAP